MTSKPMKSQVEELQLIFHEIEAEKMVLSESFQVAAMIEKLPPSWKDFKNYLKHKRKEMGLEDLIIILKIEERIRIFNSKAGNPMESRANVVEGGNKVNKSKKRKRGNQDSNDGPKMDDSKRFSGKCYICDKPGHHAKDCRN